MLIHTQNTIDAPHSKKKRAITGDKRREYAEALQLQKGDLFKRRLITKYQEYGEQAAPIIPNTPVITQIRHEELQGVIKQVGFDKFFLIYWTHQQSDIYNDLVTLESIVSIDATGSVVRKISFLQNYDSGPIFLYQIVIYIGSLIVPVCQMLSERHDTKIVTFWLHEWISSNVKVPLEVVTDMSLALQNGLSWTNVMRKHYNSENYVATSARSENYFKYVKENVLEDRQPTRADMFLIQHLQTISPRVIEARAAYDKHQMENWRNKNKNEETEDITLADNQNEFSDDSISMNDVNVVIDKCKISANKSEMNQCESSEEDTPSLPSDSEMKSTSSVLKRQLTPLVTSGDTSTKFSIDFRDSNASKENNNLLISLTIL
ncbi:uncharacterized protein LOC141535899 [Cotesia typhae]|uniref:uncharacterized protein LOC141535899 n=1 Tax=Cotesia typhae TaxID=2053667 RepID=UPI003D68CD2F